MGIIYNTIWLVEQFHTESPNFKMRVNTKIYSNSQMVEHLTTAHSRIHNKAILLLETYAYNQLY